MTNVRETAVTVAIAAYNAVPFIARALSSALTQSGVEIEVIVVDDASTDNTVDFIQTEFGSDPRVSVLRIHANAGPAAARNLALSNAKGTWIAILDADDAFEAGHLSKLLTLGEEEKADIVAANFAYFDVHRSEVLETGLHLRPKLQILDKYTYLKGARPFTEEADFGLLQPLFRTDFLRLHGLSYPTDVRHGEDMELVLNALLLGAKYVVDRDLCSYLYTTRDSGHSRTPVDYGAQVRRTLWLQNSPLVRGDGDLIRLLAKRAGALKRLELDRNWDRQSAKKGEIACSALSSKFGREWLFSRLVRKIAG